MKEREALREAIRNYINKHWNADSSGVLEDELERSLAGVMAFLAVEQWEKPFTPFGYMPIIEEDLAVDLVNKLLSSPSSGDGDSHIISATLRSQIIEALRQ